jgi:periplasmic protein TonB
MAAAAVQFVGFIRRPNPLLSYTGRQHSCISKCMFNTRIAPHANVNGRALYASLLIHAAVIAVICATPTGAPQRFGAVQIVHAAEITPIWLPRIKAPPAQQVNSSSLRQSNASPLDPPEQRMIAAAPATIPPDIAALGNMDRDGDVPATTPQRIISMSVQAPPLDEPRPPAAEPEGTPAPIRIGGRVQIARLVKQTVPVYPPMARTARVEGTVAVTAVVTESGALEDIEVLSGHPMLIDSALNCVRQWKYEPARLNGVRTRSTVHIDVIFRLIFSKGS